MLTPDELKVAPDNIVALYQQLEDDIIADIARRLEKAGEITGSAEWQIYMLAEMGKDLDDIKDKIAEVNHKSKAEVERIFDEAIARSVGRDNLLFQQAGKRTLDLAKNAGMQQFIAASAAKTAGDLKNLTKSLGFKDGKQFKPIARFYQDTLNYAQFQVASGAFSYQQAIKIATAKMVESGIRVVDYESGVSTRVDVAVRRATLTGINQTAAQITLMQMGELGGEYVEVTAHAGARPSHADWQGKVYHVGGDVKGYPDFEESTGYGTGEGLCGWNCRHNFHPFFPGISERNYTDKELENIDPPPFEYNGKTYTHYEATQKQRQIERAIRKTKQEIIAYDAAGLKEDFTWASVKLQRQKELYRDFSAKAGLRTKDERHQLFGFGKGTSQKSVHVAKRKSVEKTSIKEYNVPKKMPSKISAVRKECSDNGIEYNSISKSLVHRTTDEIVALLGGGDRTKGSCASVAFAYAGNKAGYDVLDFRGGLSQELFSRTKTIERLANLDKVESFIVKDKNDFNAVLRLIQNVKPGKEYFLATGSHAAIIRKAGTGFEFLELQTETKNGFNVLTNRALKSRFGCKKSHSVMGLKYEKKNILIDIESLGQNDEFKRILGYINTDINKQLKGVGGGAK